MSSPRRAGAPLLGTVLLLLGVLLLLDNLGVWELDVGDLVSTFWPLALVYVGGRHLLQRRLFSGVLFLAAGLVLQLATLDVVELRSVLRWWPLLLIGLGVWLVLRSLGETRADDAGDGAPGDTFRIFQMWGGTKRVVTSRAFRGGEATAFMAGVEVDLRDAELAPRGGRIDVTALMGGVELMLPESWEVVVTGSPFLGAIEDSRKARGKPEGTAAPPRLEIRATVFMGGLEIR